MKLELIEATIELVRCSSVGDTEGFFRAVHELRALADDAPKQEQQPDLAELICRHRMWIVTNERHEQCLIGCSRGEENYSSRDPASLRAAVERLVKRIEG
jgi:hypothetical protein